MADLILYPANMKPSNALVARQTAATAHQVVQYSGEELSRPRQGPANPFKDESTSLKRKNVLTGTADEIYLSEHTFRNLHRGAEARENVEALTNAQLRAEQQRIKGKRQKKGDATIAEGDDAYVGPWGRYQEKEYDERSDDGLLASDEEYEEVSEDDHSHLPEAGNLIPAMPQAIAQRKEAEERGNETSEYHGSEQYDYQGRTYMHVPQDLDIDLRKESGSIKNYAPKKLIHTWRSHKASVNRLQFFPSSGHLLLSASADTKIKIWDVYHQRELLRTYSGHTKALTDINFNLDGTRFLSAGHDRSIKLWDTETGACLANAFPTQGATAHCVKFNPDPEYSHEFLAGMSNKKILQFDTRTRELVQEYDHHLAPINTLEFIDQSRRFMSTSDDKSLRAWDYNIPVPIKFIAEPYMYPMVASSSHPSGKYVVYQSSDNQILVYGATDKFRQNRKKCFKGHNNAGFRIDVAVSPDGGWVAGGDTSGDVCFWDWKTCKLFERLRTGGDKDDGKKGKGSGGGATLAVQWHPQESSRVAAAGQDGIIRYWGGNLDK